MFDFLKKTHRITYASVSFDGTRPYNEDSLKILDTDRRKKTFYTGRWSGRLRRRETCIPDSCGQC